MDINPRDLLVIEAIELLRQIRLVHNESDSNLMQSIDQAVQLLEESLKEHRVETERISGVLKILGQALAALPAIERLIKFLRAE